MVDTPFLNGIKTGLFLQLAIGPVFFYLVSIAVESSLFNSLMAVLAVTVVDYLYIGLSIIGIGTLLHNKKTKQRFGILGSLVLVVFGLVIFSSGLDHSTSQVPVNTAPWTAFNSFLGAFILTLSSPLTIVFWSSIFSAKALEHDYRKRELTIFGIGAGTATFLFLGSAMSLVVILQSTIPGWLVESMNCLVGLILISYGITRTVRAVRTG